MKTRISLLVLLSTMLPSNGAAQAPRGSSAPASAPSASRTCFWPAPQPTCFSWFITEGGIHRRFSDLEEGDENLLFTYSLGWMRNVGNHAALGVQVFAGAEGDVRGGIAMRARAWMPRQKTAVDVSVGVHLSGVASGRDVTKGSPMFATRITYRDKAAVVAVCSPGAEPHASAKESGHKG